MKAQQKKQLFFGSVGLVLLILIVRGCGGGASGLSVGDVQAIVDQRVELVNSAMLQQLSGGQPGAAPASDTLKAIPAMRDEIVKLRQEVTELQKQVVAINSRFEETAREIDQVERLASRKGAVAGSVPPGRSGDRPCPPIAAFRSPVRLKPAHRGTSACRFGQDRGRHPARFCAGVDLRPPGNGGVQADQHHRERPRVRDP